MKILFDKYGVMLQSQYNAYKQGRKHARTIVVADKPKPSRKRSCSECNSVDRCWTTPMLKDVVWLQIAGKRDILCFECAEKRLGREITIDDLNHAPINYGFHKIWERAYGSTATRKTSS